MPSWRALIAEAGLLLAVACHDARSNQRALQAKASDSALSPLAPRQSSPFSCEQQVCRQPYPRLPSSGEWRCAERNGTVWCAGGAAAAGVVASAGEPGFRCGRRWGAASGERVCIDSSPEYPQDGRARRCSFEQERGIVRVCRSGDSEPSTALALPPNVIGACWLDGDCRSGGCDRGSCRCAADRDCELGQCRAGHCVEAER